MGMLQSKRGVSNSTAVAILLVAVIAGSAAAYLYHIVSGSNKAGGSSSRSQGTTAGATAVRSTGSTSAPPPSTNTTAIFPTITTTTTYLPPATTHSSSGPGGWQDWAVANATLGYYRTQAFVHNAWNYTFNIYQSGNPSPNVFTVSDIIGALEMNATGNWTSGYTLTFTPHELNVTVEYNPPSAYYPVIFFNVQNGSDFQQSIEFNSTQQRAISIALANATTRSDLSKFPYFADDAFQFPAGNKTYGGDYVVWFFQTNGPKIVGAFVNLSSGTVVATYASTRATQTCYSNGLCFSSPWALG